MGPIARPQITFSLAAHAAGITEKALRNWLDKGQVWLEGDDDREQGQWRRFSLMDVVRLAVIGSLVRYGIGVPAAAEIIATNVDHKLRAFARDPCAPRRALYAALNSVTIVISNGGAADGDDRLNCRFGYGPADTPDTHDLRHFILIRVDEIANDVLARLDADAEDKPSEWRRTRATLPAPAHSNGNAGRF